MIERPAPSRAVAALINGLATATYYATPDFIPSRTARGWVKAGLTAVSVAASVPDLRATWAAARGHREVDDGASPTEVFRSLSVGGKAVALGSGAALLAGAVGGVLKVERRAFRHGEARAASGKRWPHTGPALLYGALASGLWFLPPPSGTR
jgi:hypothetical protein